MSTISLKHAGILVSPYFRQEITKLQPLNNRITETAAVWEHSLLAVSAGTQGNDGKERTRYAQLRAELQSRLDCSLTQVLRPPDEKFPSYFNCAEQVTPLAVEQHQSLFCNSKTSCAVEEADMISEPAIVPVAEPRSILRKCQLLQDDLSDALNPSLLPLASRLEPYEPEAAIELASSAHVGLNYDFSQMQAHSVTSACFATGGMEVCGMTAVSCKGLKRQINQNSMAVTTCSSISVPSDERCERWDFDGRSTTTVNGLHENVSEEFNMNHLEPAAKKYRRSSLVFNV